MFGWFRRKHTPEVGVDGPRLVVGLGNPGSQYDRTRHNVGFEVIEELARRHGYPASRRFKKAEVAQGTIAGEPVLLIEPMTYMNLSGDSVGAIMRYYKSEPADVIVVHDELDFDPGLVKVKPGGGHGGHNGLRSISSHIGRDFPRVRVGVGKPPKGRGVDHVLSGFDGSERQLIDEAIQRSADAVEAILKEGVQKAMNIVNSRAKLSEPEDNRSS